MKKMWNVVPFILIFICRHSILNVYAQRTAVYIRLYMCSIFACLHSCYRHIWYGICIRQRIKNPRKIENVMSVNVCDMWNMVISAQIFTDFVASGNGKRKELFCRSHVCDRLIKRCFWWNQKCFDWIENFKDHCVGIFKFNISFAFNAEDGCWEGRCWSFFCKIQHITNLPYVSMRYNVGGVLH